MINSLKSKKINRIISNNINSSALLILYGAMVSFLFVNWVIPVYGYIGTTIMFNDKNLLLSIFYIIILSAFINLHKNKVKIIFNHLLLIQVIIPMLCLYSFSKEFAVYDKYVLMCICCVLLISMLSLFEPKTKHIYFKEKIKKQLVSIVIIAVFFTTIRYIVINGLKIINFNFYKVYSYRLILQETMSGYLVYLDGWTYKVLNPLCISLALYYKKKIIFIFFFVLQIILFGLSSHKSVLFNGVVVVLIYNVTPYLLKRKHTLIKVGIYLNLSAIFLWRLNVDGWFCAIYNRAIFTPAKINYYYYDYFSKNGFDWFKQSFLKNVFNSKYELNIPRIIGLEYFGDITTSSNTGFLGSGYAQGGFVVILFYSIAVAILIITVSSLVKKLSPRLVLSVTLFPISSLFTSSDLPTSFLTGGILLSLFLLYLLSFDKSLNIRFLNKIDLQSEYNNAVRSRIK